MPVAGVAGLLIPVLTVAGEPDMATAPRPQQPVNMALRKATAGDVVVDLSAVTFRGSH